MRRMCHLDTASLIRVETFTGFRTMTRATAGSFEKGLALGQSRPARKNLGLSLFKVAAAFQAVGPGLG